MTIHAQLVRRLNIPSRAREIRVVSELDGITGPVDPQRLLDVCKGLWSQATKETGTIPNVLLGLDSGGIVPTIGLSLVSGVPYQIAYKVDLNIASKIEITEPYAVSRTVFAYNLSTNASAYLVDDEVFSGETASNAVRALRDIGLSVLAVLCLVESASGHARERIEELGVPLFSVLRLNATDEFRHTPNLDQL